MLKFIVLSLLAVASAWGQFPAAQNQYVGSRNLLNNPGFENGVRTSWTFSGNTATISPETIEPLKDKVSLKAVAAEQVISLRQYVTTPAALGGSSAQIKFSASNTAPGVVACVGHNGTALSGASNCITLAIDGVKRDYVIPNVFGSSSTGIDVLSSSTTGTLVVDSVELGDRLDVSDVQQARLHGSVRTPATANCGWSGTSTTLTGFAEDPDCPVPTVSGDVAAPATKIPGFILKGEPGDYFIQVNGTVVANQGAGENAQCALAINDGTKSGDTQKQGVSVGGAPSVAGLSFLPSFKYTKTTSADVTLQIFYDVIIGQSCNISSSDHDLAFTVYYYPPANKVFSMDSLGWFIDANIGGANPDLGLANVSTYTEITNAGLDLVVNTAKGSQPAKILCSGTNPPTGTTCSAGNESVGISFVIPKSGQYKVCAAFSDRIKTGSTAGSSLEKTFQLIETPVNAQTILQEGDDRQNSYLLSANASTQQAATFPISTCSIFNFSSTGEKAIRLMYEQLVAASPETSLVLANRASGVGQRDIHFTVKPAINLERINGSFAQIEDALEEVYVYAHSSGTAIDTAFTTMVFATEVTDTASAYNNATGVFTSPIAGTYMITAGVQTTGVTLPTTDRYVCSVLNGGQNHIGARENGNGASNQNYFANVGIPLKMAAGETAAIQCTSGTATSGVNSQVGTWLRISRIPTP